MLKSRTAPAPRPTVAYSAGRKITLAPWRARIARTSSAPRRRAARRRRGSDRLRLLPRDILAIEGA